ncbi:hypothetical protein R3P38DRAFT_2769158 [Favolaschia claudopus]|uniref:Uncharacterized protein n=1 Tax=Favolaschia claudopus TaxID=2862362 RepID=A0AAW0CNN1_9AGAR
MARATRSTLQLDKSPLKLLDSKKRKRTSDSADQPAQKLQRTESIPDAATKPIDPSHAAQILHVLDAIDRKHAFLDRAFPLEQSSNSSPRHSLRTLLSDPNKFTLSTLRTAVQNLLPISIHPRASISPTAAEQQRFCDIALSLLDQASFHPISLDIDSLLPQEPTDDDPSSPRFVAGSNKRYALMQSLPGNATYWSSANLPPTSAPDTGPSALKDLPTGHAHLVAVFPTPSTSASTSTLPKLGDYARAPVLSYDSGRSKHVAPTAQRRVTCGSFLDYGAFASFAPSWVGNGREIGQRQLGEVYAQRAQRYREKLEARQRAVELQQAALLAANAAEEKADDAMEPPPPPDSASKVETDVDALEDILSPNEIESLKAVLGSLELENAVTELLTRNRIALQRLGQLQVERLRAGKGKSPVEEGDEEWDVAHGILDSLTLLASLRPRSSAHPATPLIPPPAVLHTLHRTLPRAATPGWRGTLPARSAPATALRDDTTVKVRAGVAAAPPAPAPTPVAPVSAPTTATGYYPHFYQTQQAQAQQTQTPRPSPMPLQQQQSQSQSQQPYQQPLQYRFNSAQRQPGYFPANQTPYGYAAATGAWPYGGAYGHGSVTPGTQTVPYGSAVFSANTSGASTPVPMGKAVANTVAGVGKGVVGAQGQWGGASYGGGTPLPPHLRNAGGSATPG